MGEGGVGGARGELNAFSESDRTWLTGTIRLLFMSCFRCLCVSVCVSKVTGKKIIFPHRTKWKGAASPKEVCPMDLESSPIKTKKKKKNGECGIYKINVMSGTCSLE